MSKMAFGPRPSPPPTAPGAASPTGAARPVRMGMPEIDFPEVRAAFAFEGKPVGEIGLRYKGNSSFMGAQGTLKKSFKLDFNQFEKQLRFFGLTKLNLNNNFADPSQMRESLSYEIFRQAGVPAPRTAYTQLYLTVPGEHERRYLGLYTLVEQVDERFLQRHFATKKGLLVKPELPAGLPYLGDEAAIYEQAYDAKENVNPAELQRLAAFTKLINQADDSEFNAQIRSFMNVNAFLKFLAVHVVLANGDSLLAMGHNYYIYHEPKEEQFYWLPWDLNMSLGGFPMIGTTTQQMELSLLKPHTGSQKLIDRLLANPSYKTVYLAEVEHLLTNACKLENLNELITARAGALRATVQAEGPQALAAFDRALGSTLTAPPIAQAALPERANRSANASAGAQPNPAGMRLPGGNVMFGGMGASAPPLKPFIAGRLAAVQAQLDGRNQGYEPRGGFPGGGPGGRGGPGGGPGFGGPGAMLAEQLLPLADGNKDGKLSLDEMNAATVRWFRQWAGKQTTLDAATLTKGFAKIIQPPPGMGPRDGDAAPPDMPGSPPSGPMFGGGPAGFVAGVWLQAADGNHDQKLTALEFKQFLSTRFAIWDADHNKLLDQSELGQGLGSIFMPPGFARPGLSANETRPKPRTK